MDHSLVRFRYEVWDECENGVRTGVLNREEEDGFVKS